jgi:type IV secretory pathway protease TraF
MTQSRSVLVLLAALVLSVSFAVPAEDVPETAYDESESLPCGITPVVSVAAPKAVGEAAVLRAVASQLFPTTIRSFELRRSASPVLSGRIGRSLIILDHSFRR